MPSSLEPSDPYIRKLAGKFGRSQRHLAIGLLAFGILICELFWTMILHLEASSCSDGNPVDNSLSSSLRMGNSKDTIGTSSSLNSDPSQTNFGGIQARAFSSWPKDKALPCVEPEKNWPSFAIQRSPAHQGFLMVKEMKTGSSTAAGINLRIARNVARRNTDYNICKLRNDHGTAEKLEYGLREKDNSFLWTIIRDPMKRAISQFFHFQVSRKKVEPTDANFQKWIQEDQWMYRYYLRTLSVTPQDDVWEQSYDPIAAANKIIEEYDFIGVTERMEESAVALQLLLGLSTGDILFVNAKNSGGFDDGAAPNNQGCVYIVPSFISPGMKDYFESSRTWKALSATDTFLHQAASRSLDLTIQRLGKERFESALQRFRWAQSLVKKECLPATTFPCTPGGERVEQPNCFWADSGCGTSCLDDVAEKYQLYDI